MRYEVWGMTMQCWCYRGPNIALPGPGVEAVLHAPGVSAAALRDALKGYAARCGIVIGGLRCAVVDGADGYLSVLFATPTPARGEELVQLALDALTGGDDFDADEACYGLQRRVRTAGVPLAALQLLAEAQARGVPAWPNSDNSLQIGTGQHGTQVQIDKGAPHTPPVIDWSALGAVPLVMVTGVAAHQFAAAAAVPFGWQILTHARFDAVRAALADSACAGLLVAPDIADLATCGAPVDTISGCILLQPEAHQDQRHQRAALLPLLLTAPGGQAMLPPEPAYADVVTSAVVVRTAEPFNLLPDTHFLAHGPRAGRKTH